MLPDDTSLLMHFLDAVFLLEYPLYRPAVLEGGRGWLLTSLLRTKPLYHAAMALGAHHRRIITLENLSHEAQLAASIQQERHLAICIKSVNEFAQHSCPYNALGIATAVVQLMFHEVICPHSAHKTKTHDQHADCFV
jgi:hypothetical protein